MSLPSLFSGRSGSRADGWRFWAVTALHAVVFGAAVPLFLFVLSRLLEQNLNLARIVLGSYNTMAAVAIGLPGAAILLLGLARQRDSQPRSAAPEESRHWSHPLTLSGMLLYYVGIGAWLGSLPMLGLSVAFGGLLISYTIAVRRIRESTERIRERSAINGELRRFYHQRARKRTQAQESENEERREERRGDAAAESE